MKAWIKERLTERNSKRALAVVVFLAGYFGVLDPDALEKGGTVVGVAAAGWLAVDAFLTQEAPKGGPPA